MIRFKIDLKGTNPLLQHNGRLADPLDAHTRELSSLTSKRKKTEDDHREIGRAEFEGGMYWDDEIGPYVPGENIARAIVDGGKLSKHGTAVTRAVLITTDFNPLKYTGPRDVDGLWADGNFSHRRTAKVGMQRVVRTRPIFRQWSVEAEGFLDTSILEARDLERIVTRSGQVIGLGDWRPRFGRFDSTFEVIEDLGE